MKKWKISLGNFLNNVTDKLAAKRISEYLEKKGFRVDPRSIGRQMKRWGFGIGRFYEGKKQVRGYQVKPGQVEEVTKEITKKGKIPGAIAFHCYGCEDHFYYVLKRGETVGEDRRSIISKKYPKGRYCVCPLHHPPGSHIEFGGGVHYAYALKDSEDYKKEDREVAFYDQLVSRDRGLTWTTKGPFSAQSPASDDLDGGDLYKGRY